MPRLTSRPLQWSMGLWGINRVCLFQEGQTSTLCGLPIGPQTGTVVAGTSTGLRGLWMRSWGCRQCLRRAS